LGSLPVANDAGSDEGRRGPKGGRKRAAHARFVSPAPNHVFFRWKMRVRIQSLPPLATFKAWISLESITTIKDLKYFLLSSIAVGNVEQLTLDLDGFELLNASPISHILKDNDLILYAHTHTSHKLILN
jgi:hypothetical protein